MKEEELKVDLEMLVFLSHRREDGSLALVAEAALKADPNLEEITEINRKLLFGERK